MRENNNVVRVMATTEAPVRYALLKASPAEVDCEVDAPGVMDCEVALVTATELTASELAPAAVSFSWNTCVRSCLKVSTLLVAALTLVATTSTFSEGTLNS